MTALIGSLVGLAYANFILFLANLVQDKYLHGVIEDGRRAVLWTSFVLCAFICGYIRSKHPRLYLSIVFAMIVNMFALIRGIDRFEYVFRNFFLVIGVGAAMAMVISLLLWPEDHSKVLRGNMTAALVEVRQVVLDIEKSIWTKEYAEVNITALGGAVRKLASSFKESNYEISLSRVDARDLIALSVKLEKLLDLVKVYNCTVRARPSILPLPTPNLEEMRAAMYEDDSRDEKASTPTSPNPTPEITKRKAVSFAFLEAVRMVDMISDRVRDAYESKTGTRNIPVIEISGFESHMDTVEKALSQERERRTDVDIGGTIEAVAFMDLLNTIIVDVLDTVYAAAKASNDICSTGKLKLFLPIKFRRGGQKQQEREKPDTSCEPTSWEPEYELDENDDDDAATTLVLRPPEERWYTKLSLSISRVLSRIKHSRHAKYAIKFAIVMGILSSPAYIGKNYIWYESMRAQWALISAMIAMETTRGMTFRTAGMKICGAVAGGVSAFITMHISQGNTWGNVAVAFVFGE